MWFPSSRTGTVSRSYTSCPPSWFARVVPDIPPPGLPKSSRPASRGRDYDGKGGPRDGTRPGSRLLQPPLPRGEGVRRLETRDRPLPSQRVRTADSLQDGDRLLGPPFSETGRLPCFHRSQGRLLPDTCPHFRQKMAPFRSGWCHPPIQSSASACRPPRRSSPEFSPRCRLGPTPEASASSGTWTTGWSWPCLKPEPESTSRTSYPCATP